MRLILLKHFLEQQHHLLNDGTLARWSLQQCCVVAIFQTQRRLPFFLAVPRAHVYSAKRAFVSPR